MCVYMAEAMSACKTRRLECVYRGYQNASNLAPSSPPSVSCVQCKICNPLGEVSLSIHLGLPRPASPQSRVALPKTKNNTTCSHFGGSILRVIGHLIRNASRRGCDLGHCSGSSHLEPVTYLVINRPAFHCFRSTPLACTVDAAIGASKPRAS